MRILMTGATGFVGQVLLGRFLREGHTVTAWVRAPQAARAQLAPQTQVVDAAGGKAALIAAVEQTEAIINLAGTPIAEGRWTKARRQRIEESRVGLTNLLVDAVGAAARRPEVLVSASAVGYYGDRGDEPLDESSLPGTGFLAEICVAWERAALRAEGLGLRVLRPRFGVVLGPGGGFLGRLLPLVRKGLGAPLGSGRQFLPWIHIEDLADVVASALADPRYQGAVNLVAPQPIRMAELMQAMGRAAGRHILPAVPAILLRLALGEMADMVLGSQRLAALQLRQWDHHFRFAEIDAALASVISAGASPSLGAGGR